MNKTLQAKITFPLHPEPLMNEPGMCKSTIGYRSSLGLKFFVTKENLDLSWKIKLKRGNIKFRYDRQNCDTAVPTDRAGPIIIRDGFESRQVQGFFLFPL